MSSPWTVKQARGKKLTCFNCNQEGHFRKDCPRVKDEGAPEKKKLVCFICNEEGHFKQDCPNRLLTTQTASDKRLCFHCNQPGHLKQDCPNNRSVRPAKDLNSKVCFHCNQSGHLVKDCPNKEEDSGEKQVCFMCKQPGHLKQDCPDRSDWQNSKVQCYNCSEFGHFKRDCPELLHDSASSNYEPATPSNGHELGKKNSEEEEHWPILTRNPEVKSKSKQSTKLVEFAPAVMSSKGVSGHMKKNGEFNEGSRVERKLGQEGGEFRGQRTPFPPFIDTHCHVEYVFERYEHTGTFSDFMKEWKYPKNFDGCIASFCDPAAFSSFGAWSDLLADPASKVWAAFGIHPHNAKYYHSTKDLEEKLLKCLEHERCVALGEIGLDYGGKSQSDHATQKEVFVHQLKLGVALNKPFVLHCRDAEEDMLDLLKQHVPQEWMIHFHCFTGKVETAQDYLSSFPNSYLGVCGIVTFENAYNVISVVRKIPLERLLVETDAPYHTPRNLPKAGRCRHSHPAHAHYVAKEIARIKGLDLVEVLQTIRENTRTMYGI